MAAFLYYQDTPQDMGRAHDVIEQGESQMKWEVKGAKKKHR
jgi:hypothetical protein